tara:strand:+ start:575 stop:823 length:249 start_codon:yes stop_codon:yes gene_type:complete
MITANDIKTRGVKVIEEHLEHKDRVGITVRGKIKYVVMPVEEYDEIREKELDLALLETKKEIEDGDCTNETADEHIKRLWNA